MAEKFDEIRELIGRNELDSAFAIFKDITKSDKEVQDQLITLFSKYRDVRKKENLGLITSAEAFVIRSQVNYALLSLVSDYENSNVGDKEDALLSLDKNNKPGRKTVFISYNHNDVEVAKKLKEKLVSSDIKVTIDSESMRAGDDIKEFIDRSVRETETTISIISKKSILSAWVAMESINTFYGEKASGKKKFVACYIENDFFNRNFTDDALDIIDGELREIENIKKERIARSRNTRDLDNEYTRLKELSNGMDEIIRRLRESLCIDIKGENLENNFNKILQAIV